MASLNLCQIIGNAATDAELKHTPQGTAVVNLRVGVTERWKDKESGEQQKRTEWFSVTFWNRQAEIAAEFIKKGSLIYVEGKQKTKTWQDDKGETRYATGLEARALQLLKDNPNAESAASTSTVSTATSQPQQKPPAKAAPAQAPAQAAGGFSGEGSADFGDDTIPF